MDVLRIAHILNMYEDKMTTIWKNVFPKRVGKNTSAIHLYATSIAIFFKGPI